MVSLVKLFSATKHKAMSDEERELEQELDSDDELNSSVNTSNMSESGRRAHHNALERKRRDHIKDSFNGLKDAIPTLQVRFPVIQIVCNLQLTSTDVLRPAQKIYY